MSERIENAQRALISFELGEQTFCVDIMCVREIRGWTNVTPLPQAQPFVRGVISLRGAIIPVLDLGARLNLHAVEESARAVIIVVQIEDSLVGLLVDAVSDIVEVAGGEIQLPPDMVCDRATSVVSGLIQREGRMYSEIALPKLVPNAGELALAA